MTLKEIKEEYMESFKKRKWKGEKNNIIVLLFQKPIKKEINLQSQHFSRKKQKKEWENNAKYKSRDFLN